MPERADAAQCRFGFAYDPTGRLRIVRTYEGKELRVLNVPETWRVEFTDEPPAEMVEAAFEAAFPGMPPGMTVDEAKRRLGMAIIGALRQGGD